MEALWEEVDDVTAETESVRRLAAVAALPVAAMQSKKKRHEVVHQSYSLMMKRQPLGERRINEVPVTVSSAVHTKKVTEVSPVPEHIQQLIDGSAAELKSTE